MNFTLNFTLLSSVFTAFSLCVFLGILCWAYSKNNRARFEALGQLLLEEEDGAGSVTKQSKQMGQ